MLKLLISGFSAGLSVGIYCIGTCLPVFIPLLLSKTQDLKKALKIIGEFSLGRLLGYLFFGLTVAYVGKMIENNFIHRLNSLFTILGGLLLLVYALGFLKWSHRFCRPISQKIKIPLILGLTTGVNVCLPFLISLSYVFTLRNVVSSLFYFLAFFVGTSFYLLPASGLVFFSDDYFLQRVARIAGIFIALVFIYKGFWFLL